ncbi:hypothetical protein [Candidatus Sororendozoicomonas aggregata]|uniref:hypothetical protein n=1 Tax=Candidatus Sororendozoicomonas aggregata TaxID=3073239 RepID=UPI002ED521AA
MYKKHQSRIRKFMANKSFIFFTGLLSLSVTDFAYSLDGSLSVKNNISPNNPYYSKKGYTVKSIGSGDCIKHLSPTSYTAMYGAPYGKINIKYNDDWGDVGCGELFATHNFNVINNDTGKVVAKIKWVHSYQYNKRNYVTLYQNPGKIMVDVTKLKDRDQENKLNFNTNY